ncbi:hypothetical protein LL06_00905 [Hoeflea sp. BAL378]|uniref:hypothetical protein n=1 Tax=Hoeflea sp. BAL378 TaxID=1547437 RepID=UPI0005130B25|nr:hypothetical protein [Hoeflea sp. BAL378]KGF71183.1 hypothetical protein LL06_00905 [Hoeflea sp. BAL378]
MRIEDISKAVPFSERRAALNTMRRRIVEEPLRLVLGKGSGEIEVVLSDQAMARIKREAANHLGEAITEIDASLAALGVEL